MPKSLIPFLNMPESNFIQRLTIVPMYAIQEALTHQEDT